MKIQINTNNKNNKTRNGNKRNKNRNQNQNQSKIRANKRMIENQIIPSTSPPPPHPNYTAIATLTNVYSVCLSEINDQIKKLKTIHQPRFLGLWADGCVVDLLLFYFSFFVFFFFVVFDLPDPAIPIESGNYT